MAGSEALKTTEMLQMLEIIIFERKLEMYTSSSYLPIERIM